MADHPDRHTCGKCGNMFYKLTKDGKRLPIPKQNKPAAVVKEAPAAAAKGGAKGKKK
jgi:Ribosomal protein S27a